MTAADETGPADGELDESTADRLTALIKTQQETIDYLVQYVERVEVHLNDRQDELSNRLDGKARASKVPPDITPIDWLAMDAAAVAKARQGLTEFVDYLVDRHGFRAHVRPCWFEHAAAVEELTSLWNARGVAYASNSDATMPSWWLDLLDRSQFRLRKMFAKCRDGHAAADPGPWLSDEQRDRMGRWVRGEKLDPFD